jgi:hypothetical protein
MVAACCADSDVMEPQEPVVARLTLGRGKWLSYVTFWLVAAVALGIVVVAGGELSVVLVTIYFACVAGIALDFLWLDAYEIEVHQEEVHARSLLRSSDFDLKHITRVKRSPWPMLFGMRIYRVTIAVPQGRKRRLKIISTGDPRDAIGQGLPGAVA